MIQNDTKCQAVCIEEEIVMAVFHDDPSFAFGSKIFNGKIGELLFKKLGGNDEKRTV